MMTKNQSGFGSTGSDLFKTNTREVRGEEKNYSYASIPMAKDLPQWNASSAVLRNSTTLYSIPRDSRFK